MLSLMMSIWSSYCSVSNRFLNLIWISICFDLLSVPPQRPVSCCSWPFGGHFQCRLWWWLLPQWRFLACFLRCNQFLSWLHRLGVSSAISPLCFLLMVYMILYFLDIAHSTKVSPLSFFISTPNLPVSIGFVRVHWNLSILSCNGLVYLRYHSRRCRRYLCLLHNMLLHIRTLSSFL